MDIKKQQAAIIFDEDGSIDLIIPELKDDDHVPNHIMSAVFIMQMLQKNTDKLKAALDEITSEFYAEHRELQ